MNFIKKLFGRSKDVKVETKPIQENKVGIKPIQENKVEKTPIAIIEEELNILFPQRFKKFLMEKLSKEKSIKIELADTPDGIEQQIKFLNRDLPELISKYGN